MKKLFVLIKGDIVRLFKYKIMWFGFGLSLIWVLVLSLSAKAEATALMPFLLVMDTGMMAIVLLASSFFYEKQENTVKSLFVAPVFVGHVLISKIVSSLAMSAVSIVLVSLTMLFVHGVVINYALAILYVVLSTLAHVAIGYIIVFSSRDFTSFLMKCMGVIILLMLPTLLFFLGVIDDSAEYLAILSPSYAIQFLMDSLFMAKEIGKVLTGIAILAVVPAILFPLVVYPKFKSYATRG